MTSIFLMRIAIESPTVAPSTRTGCVTSCPPRKRGVIIGPQQPGAVLATIVPPSASGPSMGSAGSSTLLVKRSTVTVLAAARVSRVSRFGVTSLTGVDMRGFRRRRWGRSS